MQSSSRARAAIAACAAGALLALVVAPGASAATRTVRDARFDTPYLSGHGRLDIVRATAERRGLEVTHAVSVRARAKPARPGERPSIVINTRGGRRSDYELIIFGSTVFRLPEQGPPQAVAAATLTVKGRTWRYRFDLDDVPQIGAGYGWAAVTQKRNDRLADVAPEDGYATSP